MNQTEFIQRVGELAKEYANGQDAVKLAIEAFKAGAIAGWNAQYHEVDRQIDYLGSTTEHFNLSEGYGITVDIECAIEVPVEEIVRENISMEETSDFDEIAGYLHVKPEEVISDLTTPKIEVNPTEVEPTTNEA